MLIIISNSIKHQLSSNYNRHQWNRLIYVSPVLHTLMNENESIDRKSDISSVRWNMIFAEWMFKTYFHILNTATFSARVRYDRALLSLKNISSSFKKIWKNRYWYIYVLTFFFKCWGYSCSLERDWNINTRRSR